MCNLGQRLASFSSTGMGQSSQFSIRTPGTWAKSALLRVRSKASWARAMQAIFKSIEPMRRP